MDKFISKMKHLTKYLPVLFLIVLASCEETVGLDIGQVEEGVAIEGLITNDERPHYVKVTRSRSFYDTGRAPAITDAVVNVTDNEGNSYDFVHNPGGDPSTNGYYFSNVFEGSIGTTYHLTVNVAGQEYTASETMFPVTTIDSLTVVLNQEEFEDPEDEGYFYEVYFYAQEPQDRVDHYLFKFYRNGEIVLDDPEDIYYAEDKFVGEEIDDLPIAGFYALGDTVITEMYSLSREAFVYYDQLFKVLNNDGGMFSPPPANPLNNLSNGAFGYFQVSAVDREGIIVEDDGL